MLRTRLPIHGVLVMIVLAYTGCVKRENSATTSVPAASPPAGLSAEQVVGYATGELSEIESYLPVLNEGRLKVAPPVDWDVAPRSKEYVVRFVFERDQRIPLPRITVGARDATAEEPNDLDRENLIGFVESLMGRMDEAGLKAMQGQVEPLMLGNRPCVRYVLNKKFRWGDRVLRAKCEVLKTVRDGRIYTIFLDANVNTLVDYRADAYAVMATMKFPLAEEAESNSGAGETGGSTEEKGSERDAAEVGEVEGESAPANSGGDGGA